MIEIKNIYKSYFKNTILKDISLEVSKGEVVSVVGPSGVGKTTLLRCIKLLDGIDSGSINIGGVDVRNSRNILNKVGYVFQDLYLFPNFTVKDNIDLPLRVVRKIDKDQRNKIIDLVLDQVGILDKKFNYPYQLSGGQQQRAAIARTLAMSPEAILFDEPTSALDNNLREKTFVLIKDLAKTQNLAIMVVTHETTLAEKYSDRIFSLENGLLNLIT